MLCIKAKRMAEIFEVRKNPEAMLAQKKALPSKQEILHRKHKFKNRFFPTKIQKASLHKLENYWYAKLNLKVQEIKMHFYKYCKISKRSEGLLIGKKRKKLSVFLPIK